MLKALMIEDDNELALLLKNRLIRNGIDITIALTPLHGFELFKTIEFDMLILDLSLPQMDGHTICGIIRKESAIPIIISSARSGIDDKKKAFSFGADDYLPKPYNPDELVFRIDAIMRRYSKNDKKLPSIFYVDEKKHEIIKDSTALKITPAEYEILSYMIKKEGAAITREELLLNIASIKYESSLKSIDVIMGRLRQKIGDDTKNPKYIISVRAVGYKFVNQ